MANRGTLSHDDIIRFLRAGAGRRRQSVGSDPGRALVAAVTLKAMQDYFYPPKNLSQRAQTGAREFLHTDGYDILFKLGIPITKLQQKLAGKTGPTA